MKKNGIIIVLLGAVVSAATFSQANIVYEEQFDGNGNAYVNDTAGSSTLTGVWADFKNRYANDTMAGDVLAGDTTSVSGNYTRGQIRSLFDLGLDASKVTNITVRIRMDIDHNSTWDDVLNDATADHFDMYYVQTPYVGEGNIATTDLDEHAAVTLSITGEANGWSVWSMDFDEGDLTGNLASLRLDMRGATGETQATSWELDYVKVSAIPEPATLGMVAMVGGAVLFIRRRMML